LSDRSSRFRSLFRRRCAIAQRRRNRCNTCSAPACRPSPGALQTDVSRWSSSFGPSPIRSRHHGPPRPLDLCVAGTCRRHRVTLVGALASNLVSSTKSLSSLSQMSDSARVASSRNKVANRATLRRSTSISGPPGNAHEAAGTDRIRHKTSRRRFPTRGLGSDPSAIRGLRPARGALNWAASTRSRTGRFSRHFGHSRSSQVTDCIGSVNWSVVTGP